MVAYSVIVGRAVHRSPLSSPFAEFIGLFSGTATYYIISGKIVQQNGKLERNTRIMLRFLNQHERKVVETLLERGGGMAQYELSHFQA